MMPFTFGELKRDRKILAAALIVVLVTGVSAYLLFSGSILTIPEITVEDINIEGITADETRLSVILLIDNKNPIGGRVKELSFDIFLDENGDETLIAHGEKDLIKIEENQKSQVEIPVDFYNENIFPLLLASLSQQTLNMTIKGSAETEFFFIEHDIKFEENVMADAGLENIINSVLKFIS